MALRPNPIHTLLLSKGQRAQKFRNPDKATIKFMFGTLLSIVSLQLVLSSDAARKEEQAYFIQIQTTSQVKELENFQHNVN